MLNSNSNGEHYMKKLSLIIIGLALFGLACSQESTVGKTASLSAEQVPDNITQYFNGIGCKYCGYDSTLIGTDTWLFLCQWSTFKEPQCVGIDDDETGVCFKKQKDGLGRTRSTIQTGCSSNCSSDCDDYQLTSAYKGSYCADYCDSTGASYHTQD